MNNYCPTLSFATMLEEDATAQVIDRNYLAWTQRLRHPAQAMTLAREAESIGRRTGDAAVLRRSLVTIGACANQLRLDNLDTVAVLREAITLCEAVGDDALLGEALVELGDALDLTHDYHAALAVLSRAIDIHQALQVQEWEIRALRLIGRTYVGLGQFAEAMEKLMTALSMAESIGLDRLDQFFHTRGHLEHCLLLNLIGTVYTYMDEYNKAVQQYRMVVRTAQKAHPPLAAKALYNMGVAYEELGNYPSALDAYQDALSMQESMEDLTQIHITLIGIGRVYLAMGGYDAAKKALLRATAGLVCDPIHATFFADALHALGDIHLHLGDYASAINCFKQVEKVHVATHRPAGSFAWLHHNLYVAYKAIGDYELALHHHEIYHRMNHEHLEQASAQKILELMVKFDTERAIKDRESLYLRSAELEQQIMERRAIEKALATAKAELEERNRELERLSKLDPLTEVYNRRYLNQTLAQQIHDARTRNEVLSVMICDVDNFKEINDHCSHTIGDEVLRTVATIFHDTVRPVDTVARFGGEEFVVIFPGMSLHAAAVLTQRLLDAVREYPWQSLHPQLAVTLSAGLAQYVDQTDHEKLIHQADQELYQAKRSGKDRYSPALLTPNPFISF